MLIVGITGPAGAGKDTIADYLVKEHGFIKLSFAGPLKAGLAAMGMPEPLDRALKEQPVPGFDFTWREAAQKLGTEFGRELDKNIWVKLVEQKILNLCGRRDATPDNCRFVLSDVRFENEAEMVRRLGGRVLHVRGRQVDLGANAGHASEAGVPDTGNDYYVWNGDSLEALFSNVRCTLWGGA